MECPQLGRLSLDPLVLGTQIIQEQRRDELEDVLLAGVVRAQVASNLRVHDPLEQRAEYRRADRAPVQMTAPQQQVAHLFIEACGTQVLLEQLAVHIGECGELLIEVTQALLRRRVQYLEEFIQPRGQVRAILAGAGADEVLERISRHEDACVVSEQAEQQADKVNLQLVPLVPYRKQFVVQFAQSLGGIDVYRVLLAEGTSLVSGNEAESGDVLGQLLHREFELGVGLQIVQTKARKVGNDDVSRQLFVGQPWEVVDSLIVGNGQVFSTRLMLGEHHTWPEEVDVPVLSAGLVHQLLELGNSPAWYPEHVEECIPEALGLGIFR